MQRMGMTRCLISAILATSVIACNTASSNTDDENQPRIKDTGSDSDSAEVSDSDSSSIWVPPPYDLPDADHPYHACDEATATGEAPDISDFDDGTLAILPNEYRAGGWSYVDDGTGGRLTVGIDDGALHATSGGWSIWGAGVGVFIAPSLSDTEHCYYDASCYAGVRFRAKGSGTFQFQLAGFDNFPVAWGGACDKTDEACSDWPQKSGTLSDEWQTFEFSYCELQPEGWGGETAPLDPKELIYIFLMLPAGQPIEIWLDDLAFFTADDAIDPVDCDTVTCPMDQVPHPEMVTPEVSWLPLTDELTLHTFDQETPHCGPIRRRYLSFVPSELDAGADVPVVMALNGTGTDAESFQAVHSQGRLDALAKRDGAIVVYANAAPGPDSSDNPDLPNAHTWRPFDDGEVDDVAYLDMVIEDMTARGMISGDNDIYLVGLSIGGGMVLSAAKEHPERFKGIAPFMAYDGWDPAPVPALDCDGVTRVIFGISPDDPGLGDGYDEVLATLPGEWARAMGLPEEVIESPVRTSLPDTVHEGEDYTGDNPIALRTRDSHVEQLDMESPKVCGRVRVLEFINAGHFWPTPELGTKADFVDIYGFPNQDLDASDAVWSFFSCSGSPGPLLLPHGNPKSIFDQTLRHYTTLR